jgi:FdhE protein
VAQSQRSIYADIESHLGVARKQRPPNLLRQEFDLYVLLPLLVPFLALIEGSAPAPLSRSARELRAQGGERWTELLTQFWQTVPVSDGSLDPAEALIAWMYLQPYAEYLADHRETTIVDGTPFTCPLCGGRPIVGVLRSEGDGAKKSLICMLCSHEWNFRRIYCPACGEEREPQMAFYSTTEIAHVRVDVCDSCHHYMKTVDLTKDGHAVPVVDELATIPLNLWAAEHGYAKLQTNLLGI